MQDSVKGCENMAQQSALTWSLVFDEEKLQALLEGVFIHIKFDLHSKQKESGHQQHIQREPCRCFHNPFLKYLI